jgi:hypothetical protein
VLSHFDLDAGIAQSVERRTENPCVGGSIPSPGILDSVTYNHTILDLNLYFDQTLTNFFEFVLWWKSQNQEVIH